MSQQENNPFGPISIDQLLALNDEMAALVRAGIPLEQGLTELGREAPGKLGLVASRLADRMKGGENLSEILESDESTFPPVWRTVVLAGIRSGHLAAALESVSRTGRRAAELRRSIAVSLIYPAIVVAIAFGMFLFTMLKLAPSISAVYTDLTSDTHSWLARIGKFSESVHIWGPLIPLAMILIFAFWWLRSGRVIKMSAGGGKGHARRYLFSRYRRRFPTVGQAIRDGRMATFAELLRLMSRQEVPMPQAVVLAADASGDAGLRRGAREIAQQIEKGEVFRDRKDLPDYFPPLLGWSIVSGLGQARLDRTLKTSAEMYRQRALHAAHWAAVYLPIVLTVVIGGSVVLLQSLSIFLPFTSLLYRLGMPQ